MCPSFWTWQTFELFFSLNRYNQSSFLFYLTTYQAVNDQNYIFQQLIYNMMYFPLIQNAILNFIRYNNKYMFQQRQVKQVNKKIIQGMNIQQIRTLIEQQSLQILDRFAKCIGKKLFSYIQEHRLEPIIRQINNSLYERFMKMRNIYIEQYFAFCITLIDQNILTNISIYYKKMSYTRLDPWVQSFIQSKAKQKFQNKTILQNQAHLLNDKVKGQRQTVNINYPCCSPKIFKNRFFYHTPDIDWMGLSYKDSQKKYKVLKFIIALANSRGGCQFIGIGKDLMVQGMILTDGQRQKWKKKVRQWSKQLPNVSIILSFLPVKDEKQNEENQEVLVRLIVQKINRELVFFKKKNKYSEEIQHIFYIKKNNFEIQKIQGLNLYKKFQKDAKQNHPHLAEHQQQIKSESKEDNQDGFGSEIQSNESEFPQFENQNYQEDPIQIQKQRQILGKQYKELDFHNKINYARTSALIQIKCEGTYLQLIRKLVREKKNVMIYKFNEKKLCHQVVLNKFRLIQHNYKQFQQLQKYFKENQQVFFTEVTTAIKFSKISDYTNKQKLQKVINQKFNTNYKIRSERQQRVMRMSSKNQTIFTRIICAGYTKCQFILE